MNHTTPQLAETTVLEHSTEMEDKCPICFDTIDQSKPNFVKTKCGHSFCFECLNTSLKENNKCPCCREDIEKEKRKNPQILDMENGVELIKQEILDFDFASHVETAVEFYDEDTGVSQTEFMTRNMMQMVRMFSRQLLVSMIQYQNREFDLFDEDEDEDEEED